MQYVVVVRESWNPRGARRRTRLTTLREQAVHLDVQVDDLDAAVAESLGAELAEIQPQANVRVMFDPDGHPFCLCREID